MFTWDTFLPPCNILNSVSYSTYIYFKRFFPIPLQDVYYFSLDSLLSIEKLDYNIQQLDDRNKNNLCKITFEKLKQLKNNSLKESGDTRKCYFFLLQYFISFIKC